MILEAAFTTTDSTARYYVGIRFATGIGAALFLRFVKRPAKIAASALILVCAVVSLCRLGSLTVIGDDTKSSDMKKASDWLLNENITQGYATFDHAGPFSCMTNGELIIASVNDMRDFDATMWLTDSRWYYHGADTSPDTPVAYITTDHSDPDLQRTVDEGRLIILKHADFGVYHCYIGDRNLAVWPAN